MGTSLVSSRAKLGKSVTVGDFSIIHDSVEIGDSCVIEDHVIIGKRGAKEKTVIGAGSIIRSGSIIYPDVIIGMNFKTGNHAMVREKTRIGDNVLVGTNSIVDGNCAIGDDTKIQSNAYITWNSSLGKGVFIAPCVVTTNDKYPPSEGVTLEGPKIEDNATLGANSILLPGVRVGRKAVIAAGSIVTKDVPAETVVMGVPARVYKKRSDVYGR